MLSLPAIAALVGAAFALRFNVLALIPATISLLTIVAMGLVVSGHDMWSVAVMMFATAASLQLGYFGASFLQMLRRSTDRRTDPEAPPLAPRQADVDVTARADDSPMTSSPTIVPSSINSPAQLINERGNLVRRK
jgi:NADH:ubiquinone oxidoreductase subunit 6 (subunit J)